VNRVTAGHQKLRLLKARLVQRDAEVEQRAIEVGGVWGV
jgi:hypothetical protein